MICTIRVIPKASRNAIKKEGNNLKVYLTKPAQEGLANKQLTDILADYFKVKRYQIQIIKGKHTRDKVVEISDA